MFLKFTNALFLIAFMISALVQYNDPDALPWIAMYLLAVTMCVVQWLGRQPRWLPRLLLALSLVWAGSLLPEILGQVTWPDIFDSLSMKTREVEAAREIGGLLLVAIWAGVLSIHQRRCDSAQYRPD